MSQNDNNSGRTPPPPGKPYTPPRLISYGHVKDLVQGTTGSGNDGTGGHSKQCWIAEALYGANDARTLLIRAWLTVVYDQRRDGWRLVALYRMFGRGTARLISTGVLPAKLFLPLFDTLVEKAMADGSASVRAGARLT